MEVYKEISKKVLKLDNVDNTADINKPVSLATELRITSIVKPSGSYYDFDGTQTTLSFPDAPWNDVSGNLVLYAKFNSTTTTYGYLCGKFLYSGHAYGASLRIDNTGYLRCEIYDTTGASNIYSPVYIVNDGIDHFAVCRITNGDISIFDNGVLIGTKTSTISLANPSANFSISVRANLALKLTGKIYKAGMLKGTYTDQECKDLSNGLAIDDKYVGANGVTFTAGGFEIGKQYEIVSVGTTDFTLIGASANTVGVEFTATGVGSGTGTAKDIGRTLNLDGGKTPLNWYDFNHNLSGAIAGATLKGLQETSGSKAYYKALMLTATPIYANNAAAIAGGLAVGDVYRNGADPDLLCIVH